MSAQVSMAVKNAFRSENLVSDKRLHYYFVFILVYFHYVLIFHVTVTSKNKYFSSLIQQ